LKLRRVFTIAAPEVGKHENPALLRGLGNRAVTHLKPQNERTQMFGYAFIDDMLPMTAKLVGDGGLFGTAQPHDVIASL
jgi:hypothetical protein